MADSKQDSRGRLLAALKPVARQTLVWMLSALGGLLTSLWLVSKPWIVEFLVPRLPNTTLISIILVESVLLAILALVVCALLYLLYFKKPPELLLKHGIKWDKDRNPHCPHCERALIGFGLHGPTHQYREITRDEMNFSAVCHPCDMEVSADRESTAHFNSVQELKDSLR